MTARPSRRSFLVQTGRIAAGLSLFPVEGCSRPPDGGTEARDDVPAGLIADLEARIPSLLVAAHVPGLSIALIRNARVVWSHGFGLRDSVSKAAPVDPDTLFEAGSVSKTVFAYAVMKLHEKRVLDLDTPLTTYVTERWIKDDPRFDQITARHVLSHTSGLQNWRSTKDPLRVHFTPGSQWLYSGEGYSYLQLVVAHLTGRVSTEPCELFDGVRVCATEIDAYLKANLLRPFGMTSSGYVWDTASGNVALAHNRDGQPTNRPGATPIMAARYGAAGGLSTSATEYAGFLIEVLDPKPSDAFRLTRTSRDEMIRPHVKVDETSSWALGWKILHQPDGNHLISHGGDNPGFKAFVVGSPARKTGYVLLTNGDSGGEVIGKLTNGDTPLNAFVVS
jgi:CubicO group peptidase (beta-lactamase class C family)